MTIFLPSFACLAILPIFPLALGLAQATPLENQPVPREIIEQRLRRFSRSNWARETELRKIFEDAGCRADQLSEQRVTAEDPP